MARPMKRVTHQRAQSHAHKTHKSHSHPYMKGSGLKIFLIPKYRSMAVGLGISGKEELRSKGARDNSVFYTIQDLG